MGERTGCSEDRGGKIKGRQSCAPLSSAWLCSMCMRLWLPRGRLCPGISLPAQINPSAEALHHLSGLAKWGLGSQDVGALRQSLQMGIISVDRRQRTILSLGIDDRSHNEVLSSRSLSFVAAAAAPGEGGSPNPIRGCRKQGKIKKTWAEKKKKNTPAQLVSPLQ